MRQPIGSPGVVTITYSYDPLYRLTSASYSSRETYSYSYDAVGNRLTMVYPGGTVNYTYDVANRLTSAGGQTYTWDDNGNLLSDGVRTYQYDHANRLKQVTEGSLTTQFAYNGDGVRVGKTIGAATTDYLVDLAATLPVVISDTHTLYLYGLDVIAEQLAGADRYYYAHDGLGSVRQLLDSTGQIATRYAYDPFGVPLAGNGVPNPWQFTGEAWDAGVELLYLRARYYQPEVGRFITKDPWGGTVWQPGTLKRYVYAANNSVNLVDPSGLQVPPQRNPFAPWIGGGRDWLETAVESDPLVQPVYVALRQTLEQWYRAGSYFDPSNVEPHDPIHVHPMSFVCTAISEARVRVEQLGPMCGSLNDFRCQRLIVRIGLTALAATAQHAARWIDPVIPFELEKRAEGKDPGSARVNRRLISLFALPEIEKPLSALPERYAGRDEYYPADSPQGWDTDRWDKSFHFFTHAFLAYELRWRGSPPSIAHLLADWEGRGLEVLRGPYSANDVIANQWGSLFGISYFEDPGLLIRRCIGPSSACRVSSRAQ